MKTLWGREPVAIVALIRAAILCGTVFGLALSPEQIAAVILFTEAVLAVITRQTVTSPASMKKE